MPLRGLWPYRAIQKVMSQRLLWPYRAIQMDIPPGVDMAL